MKAIIEKAAEKLLPELPELYTHEGSQQSNKNSYLNRKLYEVTINHQLAHYLKKELELPENASYNQYSVDIEFNKDGIRSKQMQNKNGTLENIRPDIIVHKRKTRDYQGENLFIVECKKSIAGKTAITRDKNKISKMMQALEYRYGAMIVYHECKIEIHYKAGKGKWETFDIKSA